MTVTKVAESITLMRNLDRKSIGAYVCFSSGNSANVILTIPQALLLCSCLNGGGRFVRGVHVRSARELNVLGLVKLEDNGNFKLGNRVDGERWWCASTDLGREVATVIFDTTRRKAGL